MFGDSQSEGLEVLQGRNTVMINNVNTVCYCHKYSIVYLHIILIS